MQKLNYNIEAKEIQRIIGEVDYHDNKMINYSEFLAATISAQSFLTDERLWILFKHFDVDDSNFITKENFKEVMEKLGQQVTQKEVDLAIQQHDILKDGRINFEEFKAMLLGDFKIGQEAQDKAVQMAQPQEGSK